MAHSSLNGVQINGTATPNGKTKSKAVQLAKKYMKKYYADWYEKYPVYGKGTSYLFHYEQMRWYTGKSRVVSDPNGYADMSADKILKDLFME